MVMPVSARWTLWVWSAIETLVAAEWSSMSTSTVTPVLAQVARTFVVLFRTNLFSALVGNLPYLVAMLGAEAPWRAIQPGRTLAVAPDHILMVPIAQSW